MGRIGITLAWVFGLSGLALAQDVVRLRNGRILSGTLAIDERDREGFKVQAWDTGGTFFIRWNQISDAERNRLLNRTPDNGPAVELIEGVRALTEQREVVGVLQKEDASQLLIKTKDSKSPTPVPKSALLKPLESLKIRESDAYSPEEMVDLRAQKASDRDYAQLVAVAQFASSLKLYDRAKDFYLKATAADPSKKDELEPVLAQNEILIKEGRAGAMLKEIRALVESTEYVKATELANKFLAEFGDTETGKHNKDIVPTLEKEAKDFELKKAEYLAQKVPDLYRARRTALIAAAASTKYKISEARARVAKFDEEIVADLAPKLKSKPEEIAAAWEKRDQKPKTVSYGTGSWIVKGGQDGGLDTDQKYTPQPKNNNNNNNGMTNPFGGGGVGGRRQQQQQQQQQKPVDLGRKLETSAEWWASASSSDRRNFIECEYARGSSVVKKEEKTKPCTTCKGEGVFKETRMGVSCDCKCPRCHGGKEELIVTYW